ncbi:hypothetical protein AB0M97_28550 [Streptomyces sp. NPDC051207]|uniref:hypothetical protein n=1 Tax=Streptomyces sp. NPDC051207 TaxID=3154641 RepID=UPI00342FD0F2
MPTSADSLRSEYALAAERMANRVLDALTGAGGTVVWRDPLALPELAAVRILGVDLYAPQLLHAQPPDARTAQVMKESYLAFPLADPPPDAVRSWREWSIRTMSSRAGVVLPGRDTGTPRELPARSTWQQWSLSMAQLASLAVPGLESPLHGEVRENPLMLGRGASRAMLRRDYRTAARLTRWLAWLHHVQVPVPLEIGALVVRLGQVAGGSALVDLDRTLAQRMLEGHVDA